MDYLTGISVLEKGEVLVVEIIFNTALNWSAHVNYWLARGFGGFRASGSWEMFRLFQGAYLLTVYYGLEWVADYKDYVARIQKWGPPLSTYKAVTFYRFCDDFPWFGDIRNDWEFDSYEVPRLLTDCSTDNVPEIMIHDDKPMSLVCHNTAFDLAIDEDIHVIYMDGSHMDGYSSAAWIQYDRGLLVGAVGHSLPPVWLALECEMYDIYVALSKINDQLPVLLFSDYQPAI
ncbi:hypothetical protein L873DRAFT_1796414 [Choiromyces venosus 120613-1]|uniref:Uncharacterized protein n=1 Tax=Choiromyces venosus 120613-1 TaxID=1336337 RepID=A0A3N4IVS0_9PEZI|nr:hypothetical protein L873DRAFT_1796414 [Choiromyces venosus 120613-1]